MRVLVFGADGQVGTELRRALPQIAEAVVIAANTSGQVDGQRCEVADFMDLAAVTALIERVQPNAVVNAAAHTAVDRAESERDLSFQINSTAPGEIARTCNRLGIPLIHYSTDYVFDGAGSEPYLPSRPTAPLGVYGESKLAGENSVRDSGADHVILRTAWVYGNYGHNFMRTMLRLAAERDELSVVNDQIGSPTPAWLIADVTARILLQGVKGGATHHVVTEGETSWAGFADAIFESAFRRGLIPRRPIVNGIPSSAYPTPAKRPAYSTLDTTTLREAYAVHIPEWKDALDATLDAAR